MNSKEVRCGNLSELLNSFDSAVGSHVGFSKFVRDAEIFCRREEKFEIVDVNLARYRNIWFDLEIINSLALDDWESSGRPENWGSQWDERYKRDAEEIVGELMLVFRML